MRAARSGRTQFLLDFLQNLFAPLVRAIILPKPAFGNHVQKIPLIAVLGRANEDADRLKPWHILNAVSSLDDANGFIAFDVRESAGHGRNRHVPYFVVTGGFT